MVLLWSNEREVEHGWSSNGRLRNEMDEQRGCTPCTYARRAPLGCFQITALKQGNVVHPCTAFLPFKYAKNLEKGGARRACVHAVHPPVSATSYKRADFEERGRFFPKLDFHDFSRAFASKTSTKPPLKPNWRSKGAPIEGLKLGLKIEDQEHRLEGKQAVISLQ